MITPLIGQNNEIMNLLESLYKNKEYFVKLNKIKERMKLAYPYANAQYDDIEGEILSLLFLHTKPKRVFEFSPCGGWSTLYMLNSMKENGTQGLIKSFDLHDQSTYTINKFPEFKGMWELVLGDVKNNYYMFDESIDYLFIDSDHSSEFAEYYCENLLKPLLQKLRKNNKKIFVSIHDIFSLHEAPTHEGGVVINFLAENGINYFSPRNIKHVKQIAKIRNELGLDKSLIHHATTNPSIFFILG